MATHTHCRICQQPLPGAILDLGTTPLANSFLSSPDEFADEPSYPLAVTTCATCGLTQLTYTVPAEQLYREYIYVSSTSEAVQAHGDRLAADLSQRYGWREPDLLVEVASNDGTVLKAFQKRGLRVLGVEPARNVAAMATAAGVPTTTDFFTEESAIALAADSGRAAGILARHVFAHVDDLDGFLRGVSRLLHDNGILVIEVPYFGALVDNLEFDTVYHEHLSYFALQPLEYLFAKHGFQVMDVDRVSLHGGSMVLHVGRLNAHVQSDRVRLMREEEQARQLTDISTLTQFAAAVRQWKTQFESVMADLVSAGATLIGYGAAAKGNTLLNYCPAAALPLRCLLDRNPLKHGRYTPGTHVPVASADQWEAQAATHMLILAWNFQEEIVRQMHPFAQRGGRFIIPIPEPRLI